MRTPILLAVALVSGAAGAVTTSYIQSAPAPALDSRAASQDVALDGKSAKLLTQLQDELSSLDDRLAQIEVRQDVLSRALPDDSAVAANGTRREEVRNAAPAVAPEQLRESVSEALAQIRSDEEKAREKEREERRAARLDRQLEEMAKALNLTTYQVNQMRTVLTDADAKRNEAFRAMRDDTGNRDFNKMRETMTKLRADTETALAGVLNTDQLNGYKKFQEENGPGRFGRRGRGGPNGPGGPGGQAGPGPQGGAAPQGQNGF